MATRIMARHSEETSPDAYEVSCRVRMGDCIRPSHQQIERGRPPPRGLHPKERLTTPQMWVPRSCQADVESLECGDRTRRTASSTPPKMTKSNDHTHAATTCHISVWDNETTDQEFETGLPFGQRHCRAPPRAQTSVTAAKGRPTRQQGGRRSGGMRDSPRSLSGRLCPKGM
jgi:hypothetical protein